MAATPTNANSPSIALKAVVDADKNKVVFVESDDEFVDVLLSFLTMPLGAIIKLSNDQARKVEMGCINNLFESVKNIELHYFHFHGEAGKLMFLKPRSEAESLCAHLKLIIDKAEQKVFICSLQNSYQLHHIHINYSHYKGVFCKCGNPMEVEKLVGSSVLGKREGVFVNGMTRFMISDELRVVRMSSLESFTLLAKHSNVCEKTFSVGADEVLNLLISSIQTRTPLTEVLAKNKSVSDVRSSAVYSRILCKEEEEDLPVEDEKISLNLMVSKSKKIVCYAEATKDFVNFLLSFLTVPLGCIAKELHEADSNGCIDQLYQSVKDLDDKYFKSMSQKEMLVSPSLAFGFRYKNDLLGIKAASMPSYDLPGIDNRIRTFSGKTEEGIIAGATTMFVVSDNLSITPISSIKCMSILNELKVPFTDIEERTVSIGKKEAMRLLLSSFVSESALTNTFIADPKQKTKNK